MKSYYDADGVTIYHGDCRDILAGLEAASVQTCVTSPPYFGLRDYGHADQIGLEPTPDAYVAQLVAVFREVRRVLRDDGTVWLNLGDSYAGGGGYAPNAPTNQKRANGEAWGAMNAFSQREGEARTKSRPGDRYGLKPKDLIGIPWRVAFALQADGWWLRQDIIWHKPNPMPESVTDRCTKAHEYVFLLAKAERYYFDADTIASDCLGGGGKVRHGPIYSAPASTFNVAKKTGNMADDAVWTTPTRANKRSVWTVTTKPYAEAHFATFPEDLILPCILAGSPPGGVVLDPFMGSGTTAYVARKQGRSAIGCELNAAYIDLAAKRLAQCELFRPDPERVEPVQAELPGGEP